ncbi:MAG TPA: hypothetical protein VLQ92_09315 [Candidatus Limnocylindrales bacterium]|nr:hypothetical protein [Candidatus Limnocylindrales bacterium]
MARRIIAALLIIVASLLAPFAIGALWAERTITETDLFVETLAPLVDDPAVQQTVATEVSTAVIEAVDAQARIEQALSQVNGPLAELRPDSAIAQGIASGINGAIESAVTSYTQSDRFGDAWLSISTLLQEQFVALINRDTTDAAVTLQDGQIVLDTQVAVEKVTTRLTERGVPFVDALEVPGREVVLADTPNLQTAATALSIFMPVASWLWVVVLAMFVVGIVLWRPRSRGVMWTGVGLALGSGLMYVGLDLGQAQLVAQAPSDFATVVAAVTTTMLRFLVNAVLVMTCLGIALAIAGWLAGATPSGRKVRDAIAVAAHRWGSPLADGPVGRFTSDHPMFVPTLRALVIVGAAAYLALVDRRSPSMILWTFGLMALALLLVEIIEGAGRGYEEPRAGALVAEAIPAPVDAGAAAAGAPTSGDGPS